MSLNPWFVSGLIEGEGCFSVSFTLRKRLRVGIETRPSFSISLNQRDLNLLKQICEKKLRFYSRQKLMHHSFVNKNCICLLDFYFLYKVNI